MLFSLTSLLLYVGTGTTALVDSGDNAFERMEYATAISVYEKSLTMDTTADVCWRLARVYLCVGDVSEPPSSDQYYQKAVNCARSSVRLASGSSEGHAWLAASLGTQAMLGSAKEKVGLCREIKFHAEESIRLNPYNDVGLTILGSFYRELAKVGWLERSLANLLFGGLPRGSFEDSEVMLRRAIAVAPNVMRHYYELGRLYVDWKRPDDARLAFQQGLTKPILLASDRSRRMRIQKQLNSLGQK